MRLVDANGIQLAVEISEPATPAQPVPVLLIMGLGMQLTAWPAEIVDGLLAQGFTVIRFDNRDIGLSTKLARWGKPNLWVASVKYAMGLPNRAPYTLEDMAEDTRALLDVLGVGRAHVVGVSMGGMIGQLLAAAHPERVASFTCLMSSSGARHLPGPTWAARRALMAAPANPRDHEAMVDHFVTVMKTIGSPGFPTPEPVLRERIAIGVRRSVNPLGSMRQLVAIAASGDRSAIVRRIVAPTLVIHGRDDPLVPIAAASDLAGKIPGAQLRIIDGMGHDLAPALAGELLDAMRANFARARA